jgi:hypothetical protein
LCVVIFAVSPIVGPLGVVPVVVLVVPEGLGVGVVVVALFIKLPVAPDATMPEITTVAVCPAGRSASVVEPLHGPVGPPLALNCGFVTLDGTSSLITGAFAVDGPSLNTVTV